MIINKSVELSIVIPCFNDKKYVKESVKSAFNQNFKNKEIIIVDDGSDYKTKSELKSLKRYYSRLIIQENQGQGSARNTGIQLSQGEYILVLDSDDYFEPEFAAKAIDILRKNQNIKIVSCWLNRIVDGKIKDIFKPGGGDIKSFLRYNEVSGSVLFRKKDWQEIGGYDESMRKGFEDWEFYIRLLRFGGAAYVIPEVLFNYRIRNNSTTSRANKIKYKLTSYIYTKHQDLIFTYYPIFLGHILSRIEREEAEKLHVFKTLEYKIGFLILVPIRYLKNLLIK